MEFNVKTTTISVAIGGLALAAAAFGGGLYLAGETTPEKKEIVVPQEVRLANFSKKQPPRARGQRETEQQKKLSRIVPTLKSRPVNPRFLMGKPKIRLRFNAAGVVDRIRADAKKMLGDIKATPNTEKLGKTGIELSNIDPKYLPYRAGLRNGDILTHLGPYPVQSAKDALDALQKIDRRGYEKVILRFFRGNDKGMIAVRLK